jgi:class 3 adenylate cyclase
VVTIGERNGRVAEAVSRGPAGTVRVPVPVMTERTEVRRTLAFIDIVGSTRLLDAIGDAAWAQLLSWHELALGELFARHEGELVDQAGEGFFVSFREARAAIECTIAIQRVLAHHRKTNGFALELRIGLHTAGVLRCGSNYRGKGVHAVARIAALASAGEILASCETVRESRYDVPASSPRTVELAGISEPAQVQVIHWAEDTSVSN